MMNIILEDNNVFVTILKDYIYKYQLTLTETKERYKCINQHDKTIFTITKDDSNVIITFGDDVKNQYELIDINQKLISQELDKILINYALMSENNEPNKKHKHLFDEVYEKFKATTWYYEKNIGSFPLTPRSINALQRNNISTMAELIEFGYSNFVLLKGLGRKSLAEINEYLEHLNNCSTDEFIDSNVKSFDLIPYLDTLKRQISDNELLYNYSIVENINSKKLKKALINANINTIGDLCNCSDLKDLKGMRKVTLTELENYLMTFFYVQSDNANASKEKIAQQIYNRLYYKNLYEIDDEKIIDKDLVDSISSELDYVDFTILLSSINQNKLKKYSVITIKELKSIDKKSQFYNDDSIIYDSEMIYYIELLNQDISQFIKEKLHSVIKQHSEKTQFTIENRSNGETLAKVGAVLNISRARVGQIEIKVRSEFEKSVVANQINNLLMACYGPHIDEGIIADLLGDAAKIFNFLYYNKHIGEYYFYNLSNNSYDGKQDFDLLPSIVTEYTLESKFTTSKQRKFQFFIKKTYNKLGYYYFKNSPSLTVLYKIVIENFYQDGIAIYDTDVMKTFREYYFELFQDQSIFSKEDRAIYSRIVDIEGIGLIARGIYKIKSISLPDSLIKSLDNTIKKYQCLLIKGLFELHEEELMSYGVMDRYQMHTVIKNYFKDYYINRDFVALTSSHYVDVNSMIKNYAKTKSGMFSTDDVKNAIPGLADMQIHNSFSNLSEYISANNGERIHIENIIISDIEKQLLFERIMEMTDEGKIVTSRQIVRDIFVDELSDFASRNRIDNSRFAFSVIKGFFTNIFNFVDSFISRIGVPIKGADERIIEHIVQFNRVSISEIPRFVKQNGLLNNNTKGLLDRLYDLGYIRINEYEIAKSYFVVINEDILTSIENSLLGMLIDNKSKPIQMASFEMLPQLDLPWNKHLLAHVVKKHGEKIFVVENGIAYNDLSYEIVLNDE